VSAGWPGRAEEPIEEPALRRARAINADALGAIDDLLDQISYSARR
jgi:hypothetical protein